MSGFGTVPFQSAFPQQIDQAGDALMQAGAGIQRAADEELKRLAETEANESLLAYSRATTEALRAPGTGFLYTRGRSALDTRNQVLDGLRAQRESIANTIEDDRARELFMRQSGVRLTETEWTMDGHAGEQAIEWDAQNTSALIDQNADEAIEAYGQSDPGGQTIGLRYEHRRGEALAALDRLAQLRGLEKGTPAYRALRTKVTGKIAMGVADKLLAQDPQKAHQWVQARTADGDLDPQTARTLRGTIAEAAQKQTGLQLAVGLLRDAEGSAARAEAMLWKMGADRKIPVAVMEEARSELRRAGELDTRLRAEQKEQVLEALKQRATIDRSLELTSLSEADLTLLGQLHLLDEAQEYLSSEARNRSSPAALQELDAKTEDWWRDQTVQSFSADYKLRLSPADMRTNLAKLRKIRGEGTAEDMTVLSLAEGDREFLGRSQQLTYIGENLSSQSRQLLLSFSRAVDELMPFTKEGPLLERRAEARKMAMSHTAPPTAPRGVKFLWQLTDEERQGVKPTWKGQTIDTSRMSGQLLRDALLSFAPNASQEQITRAATLVDQQIMRGTLAPERRAEVMLKIQATLGVRGMHDHAVVQRALEMLEKQEADYRASRVNTPGMVTYETLSRATGVPIDKLKEDTIDQKIWETGDSDLAYGNAQTFQFDQQYDETRRHEIIGISAAAAERMAAKMRGTIPTKGITRIYTGQERALLINELEGLAAAMEPERIADLKVRLDEASAEEQRILGEDPESPAAWAAITRRAQLQGALERVQNPSLEVVERAWEAWLQEGGEVYEADTFLRPDSGVTDRTIAEAPRYLDGWIPTKWHAAGQWRRERGLWADADLEAFNRARGARASFPRLPTLEQHRRMRALVEKLRVQSEAARR